MAIVAGGTLKELLQVFPRQCSYAFAYGSAVFAQKDQLPGKMIDLVFVVDNPVEWHTENIKLNPHHYSSLKYFGAKTIASIQDGMACGVYYNPYCNVQDKTIKYGVISTEALKNDLHQWRHLYIAGRLHKPVLDLQPPINESLVNSLKKNRVTALRAVLLQQGHLIRKYTLYHGITELSYLGDTRMRLAENPEKTKNIVGPLTNQFDKIYLPLLAEVDPYSKLNEEGLITQDISPTARFKHLMELPFSVQKNLARQHCRDPRFFDIEDIMAELSYLPYLQLYIRNAVAEVVRGSSIVQTLQGILTAGVFKSTKYVLEKIRKRVAKPKSSSPESEPVVQSSPASSSRTTSSNETSPSAVETVKGKDNEK